MTLKQLNLVSPLCDPHHPSWYPHPDSSEGDRGVGYGGRGQMGKNKFALTIFSGKIKCFKTMLFFFMENPGHQGPTQPA